MKTVALAFATLVLLAGGASDGLPVTPRASHAAASTRVTERGTDPHGPIVKVAGYRLYPAPAEMRAECRRAQARVGFPVLCPTILPRAKDGTRPRSYARWAEFPKAVRAEWLYVGASYSTPYDPEHWEWNNPDLFLHFVVLEGKLAPSDIELGTRYPPKLVGTRTMGGHRGKLYEQVSYDVCGCGLGGHYTFVWHRDGTTYAASLHRWLRKPTLRVLDALIAKLKPV